MFRRNKTKEKLIWMEKIFFEQFILEKLISQLNIKDVHIINSTV